MNVNVGKHFKSEFYKTQYKQWQVDGTGKKSTLVRYPKQRKKNILCICLYMDVSMKSMVTKLQSVKEQRLGMEYGTSVEHIGFF